MTLFSFFPCFQIVMHSSHDNTHAMYKANLEANTTEILSLPDDILLDSPEVAPDEINNQTLDIDYADLMKREISARFVPSTGFK